ncbi:MAG TPA: sigma-70 family RNA polymerase sigma factor [Planctomycetota bacterium]|jgi:RNA polymerase sigma factor (sigma-70 family)
MDVLGEAVIAYRADGSEQAWAVIDSILSPVLNLTANRYRIPGTPKEDVTQALWCSVLKAMQKFDPERGQARRYLWSAARRAAIDMLRHATCRGGGCPSFYSLDQMQGYDPEAREIPEGPDDATPYLRGALMSRCSPLERRILRLYLQGQPPTEISRVSGIRYKTIENCLQRITAKARKLTAKYWDVAELIED